MIEFFKKWQGALVETTDARILICESLQVTSLFTPLPPSWWPFVISKTIHQIKLLLNYWARFFKNSP
jgi:hypothetical protein